MGSSIIGNYGLLAQTIANINQAAMGATFDLQFSQLQNTVIRRLNTEIAGVNAAGGSKADELRLKREGKNFATQLPLIEKFQFDTQTNSNRLSTVLNDVSTAISYFSDGNISSSDVTNFNTARQAVVDELNKLTQLSYVGFTDGNIIQRLKNKVSTLESLAPVVGVVDAAGTSPPTNVNRAVLTSLETLQNDVTTAQTVTNNSLSNIFDMRQTITAKLSEIQADVTAINSTAQTKKLAEVNKIKQKYTTLLKSISISYQGASGLSKSLNQALTLAEPPKGSVLNMFA